MSRAFAGEKQIIELFRQAGRKLYLIVQNADASQPFVRYRREQLGAIAQVLQRLDADSKRWAEEHIPGVMDEAAAETTDAIDAFDEQEFSFRFSGVPEEAVKVMTEEAYTNFGNTIVGLKRDGERAALNTYKLQRQITQGVIQGSSVATTQKELLQTLREQGFTVLRGKNGFGRRFSLEHYTNMLARTQMMTAYNVAASQQMLAAGRRYAIFPTIPPGKREADDPCWKWEKQKYIDLTTDPIPPASTHPNCRHKLQPVSFAQLKAERPDLYEKAMAHFRKASEG